MNFESEIELIWLDLLDQTSATAATAQLRRQVQANSRVVIVAAAAQVEWLPQIALALKTRMIRIEHYLVQDALPTTFNTQWPDAPISYFGNHPDELHLAQLRGWNAVNSTEQTLAEVIDAICCEI